MEEDLPRARPADPRLVDEQLVLHGDGGHVGDARNVRDQHDGDRQHHVEHAGPEHPRDRHREQDGGKREEDVQRAHDEHVGGAAEESSDQAEEDAEQGRDGHRQEGDDQGHAAAPDQAAENIAPLTVEAERVAGGADRREAEVVVAHRRVVGADERGQDRRQAHEPDDRRRRHREAILTEGLPEDPPLRGAAEHALLGGRIDVRPRQRGLLQRWIRHAHSKRLLSFAGSSGRGRRRRCRCRGSRGRTRRSSPAPPPARPADRARRWSCRSAARSPATRTPPP